MDSIDPVRFQRFLLENCKTRELADRAFTLVQPLMAIAQSGEYPLAPKGTVTEERIIEAISRSTKAICKDVIIISSERPVREHWTEMDDYVTNFSDCVFTNRRDVLLASIGVKAEDDIILHMHTAFLDLLLVAFYETHEHLDMLFEEGLFKAVWCAAPIAVFYLCAYAISGDVEQFEAMAALVDILPEVMPIGEPWSDTEKWIVLVK